MIRVGIIGYGKMGKIRLKAVQESKLSTVVKIADPETHKPINGIEFVKENENIINDKSIDVVFVCTPNFLNKPLTLAALKAGKHVFCEKPPAFTAADVTEIQVLEKKSGRKLMYGFNHRHHDSIIKAKNLVDSGQYGRLLWMRGRYGKSVDQSYYKTWRAKKELAGGGILIDQGIHMLDLFIMMAGNFEEVHALVSNQYWNLDVDDNVFAIMRNKEGVAASLHSTMTQWRHLFSFEMFLERGYVVLNGLLTSTGTYGKETMTIAKNRSTAPAATWSDEEHQEFEVNNSWLYEVQHLFNAIQQNKPITVGNSDDALRLMKVIDKIYKNPIKSRESDARETMVV